jgi:hypothetical protein
MTGDDPKWLEGCSNSSDTAGIELRMAICLYEVQ